MRLAVVIPARNEEELLPRCLASVALATESLRAAEPTARVRVVVVASGCADDTSGVARRAGAEVVEARAETTVGGARALGAERVVDDVDWIACTDADSVVPTDWLLTHARAWRGGVDVLRGTVEPDRAELPGWAWEEWRSRHTTDERHPYVYGANLGVRASAYRALGGFASLRTHEDVDLCRRAEAAGLRVESTNRGRVVTSARTDARCEEGFGAWIARLLREPGHSSETAAAGA